MKVYVIGAGCGPDTLTAAGRRAIEESDLLIGAGRLLAAVPTTGEKVEAVTAEAIAACLQKRSVKQACVLMSGDSGFYSGTRKLLPLLENDEVCVLPGISSVQAFAALLTRPWQDWGLHSAHGVDCDAVAAVCRGKPAFFLTGGRQGPDALCRQFRDAGLGELPVCIGQDLGEKGERVFRGTAGEFCDAMFPTLCVMLAEAAPNRIRRSPGLPDSCFLREEHIPMTKQEVRALALAKLAVGPEDLCWDIGTGTGSVAAELALQSRGVWSVDTREEAIRLAEKNRRALGAWNLRLLTGGAPEALEGLPAPDAVFVGGSGGRLEEILQAVDRANPRARICVAAAALETLHGATTGLERLGYTVEVCQVSVSRGRPLGSLHSLAPLNPVFLITGTKP
ncbi:MAG: precorrin-6y C5,15-methyltransferase (decarboxylating) subunit CbiE [Oscillospiraceae bacterium]|nr:precorrin-6y C5,15-methyltransferase (decarboxylating) subunit CbiE [Oscillospiraceae bacterium]